MSKNEKRIIYVDAGMNENKEFQIALYDPKIHLTSVTKLINIENNYIAEKYAVVSAITYVKSNELTRVVIMCDNEPVTKDPKILKLCNKYNIRLMWIPREINLIADKVSKLPPTKKDEDFYTIDFIYDLIFADN